MTRYVTRGALGAAIGMPASELSGGALVEALVEAHLADASATDLGRIWQAVSEDYVQILEADARPNPLQSWRSASGHAFECLVKVRLNRSLHGEGIVLAGQKWVQANAPSVVEFLELPAKRRCTQTSVRVWPDSDLIAFCRLRSGELRAIAVVSCKTSLRERYAQALFWCLAIRVGVPIKSVFVTLNGKKQLATCENPSKPRKLLEAYFDGAYVINEETAFCTAIRPFDDLPDHLIRWRDELAPNAICEPLELDGDS